jgi:hypothetical protein
LVVGWTEDSADAFAATEVGHDGESKLGVVSMVVSSS